MAGLLRHLGAMHQHSHQRDEVLFTGRGANTYSRIVPWLMGPTYRQIARAVSAALPAGQAAHVLDVGTGPGGLVMEIARRAPALQVTGIDLSPDMIRLARQRAARLAPAAGVRFECADAAGLPFADDTVDLVVSTLSVHHWADLPGVLRDLSRVTRPGAELWLYDFWGARFREADVARAIEALPLAVEAYAERGPGLVGRWLTRVRLRRT